MKQIHLRQGSPEWHKWRSSGIGSSDIAKIMGVSPFGSALDFYNEKAGIISKDHTNYATERGNKYEPIARDKFNRLQNSHYEPACFEHEQFEYIKASVDGYDEYLNSIIEIKVPGKKDLSLAIRGEIPEYYQMQIQWQMGAVDVDRVFYICYDPKIDQCYINTVQRDDEMIQELFAAAHEFWNNFLQGIPPGKSGDDVDFIMDKRFVEVSTRAHCVKIELDKWQTEWENIKEEILQFGNGRSFKGNGITVVKTGGRTTYDYARMEEDGLDIASYRKTGKESYTIKIDK